MNINKFRAWDRRSETMYNIAFPTWNGGIKVWKDNKQQSEVITREPIAEETPKLLKYSGIK